MERTSTESLLQVAEIELTYKTNVKPSARPQITGSSDAYTVFMQIWEEGKLEFVEQFKVLLLNRANKVLGVYHVSSGGVTGTVADPKLIYVAAIKGNACALIMAHNHPSGNLKPSKADEELTLKIKNAGAFLDIKLLDHLIVSTEGYYSFGDEGLLL